MKKFVTLILLLIVTLSATACNSTVGIYYQKRGPLVYYDFVVELTEDDKNLIEYSALKYATGYDDLGDYLIDFCSCFPDSLSYGGARLGENGNTLYTVSMVTSVSSGQDDGEPDPNYSVKQEKGFFVNKIEITQSNPLTSYIKAFNSPQEQTLLYYLKNGVTDNPEKTVPALCDAFPAIDYADKAGVQIQFNMKNPIWPAGSDGRTVSGGYIGWSADLSQTDAGTITYSYYVPNSINWMIVLAGVAVIGTTILFFALRKTKDTSKIVDARGLGEKKLELTMRKLKDVSDGFSEEQNQQGEQTGKREIDPFDGEPL